MSKQSAAAKTSQIVPRTEGPIAQLPPGAQGVQRIDVPFMTAMRVQVPRDADVVIKRSIAEARLMGEDYFWGWDVNTKDGKKQLAGMSIDGAMMLIRQWGNAVVIPEVVAEEADHWLFRATFIDLESGTSVVRLYRKHRSPPPGRYDPQRWDDMQFGDAQSRCMRNAIDHALPKYLKNRCLDAAKKAAAEQITPEKERKALIERGRRLNIDRKSLQMKLRKEVGDWDAHDCVTIRALLRCIEEGTVSADDVFGDRQSQPGHAPPAAKSQPTAKEATPPNRATMPANTPEETPFQRFDKRLRFSMSWDDGNIVGERIAAAHKEGTLSEEDVVDLRKTFDKYVLPFKPDSDKDRDPGDDG